MPTATTTKTSSYLSPLPLKAAMQTPALPSTPSNTTQISTAATLRSLYTRAARAFVIRDIPLTYSLLKSAFDLLKPPQIPIDLLSDHRRKWDILRITFESTVYISPPPSNEILPESLRSLLSNSPQTLTTMVYNRSLTLFTPSVGNAQKTVLNAAYLPVQVLTTLIYCSLKLDASDVGRVMVEDWLAHREPQYQLDNRNESNPEADGYVKVLDLYCLHILPRLEQWEYANEFLEYESEMPAHKREHLKASLNTLYTQARASRPRFKPIEPTFPTPDSTISSRSSSPAPSSSSSSSSLSTTSTHTVVPSSRAVISGLTSISKPSHSASSSSSNGTATPRALPIHANGTVGVAGSVNEKTSLPQSKSRRLSSSASSGYNPLPRSSLAHQVSARPSTPSTYALIRASLAPYLTSTRITTFLVLFVLVPLISFVLRMRRKKRSLQLGLEGGTTTASIVAAVTGSGNAEMVRRRLQTANSGADGGLVRRAWSEVVRVVGDTVRMAGSGLV